MRPSRGRATCCVATPMPSTATCGYKARGERHKAAEHLRRAAAMAHPPDTDQELIDSLLAEANELDPPTSK